jgi:hypothetical protein
MSGDPNMAANRLASRSRKALCETDLGLIYDMWCQHNLGPEVMRSTDQVAVRKAGSALQRVADVLARQLTSHETNCFRTLPEIKPSTRVRKTPQRFWLEIGLGKTQDHWQAQTVLFVEFSKAGVRLGLRFPLNGEPLGRDIIRALRPFNTIAPLDATDWCLEHRKAPAAQAACSTDVNEWLAGRYKSRQLSDASLTLSKCCQEGRSTMNELVADLDAASAIINGAIGSDVIVGNSMIAKQETLGASLF